MKEKWDQMNSFRDNIILTDRLICNRQITHIPGPVRKWIITQLLVIIPIRPTVS